jgi:GNAT superfamily N-acetyltransferase
VAVDAAVIRELREADAAAVARLEIAVNPHQVVTPRTIRYLATREDERKRRRDWVAEIDGEIVGCAQAEWPVPTRDKGRFWIGVHPERRRRGIGGELYTTAQGYLVAEGAVRLRTWVDGDPAGESFVQELGFAPGSLDTVSEVDPRGIDVSDLPRLEERGFRLACLGEVRRRVHDLYEIWAAAVRDMPSEHPETDLDFESWKRDDLEHPDLSDEGSFVALAGDRPVSLAFLTVDPARRLAYNQMTATLPDYRRRGLALMVKLASARWAAEAGIERLLTENDEENVGMLAINERLGYRPLYDQRGWAVELELPSAVPDESARSDESKRSSSV